MGYSLLPRPGLIEKNLMQYIVRFCAFLTSLLCDNWVIGVPAFAAVGAGEECLYLRDGTVQLRYGSDGFCYLERGCGDRV